jgi:dynactin-5
MKGKSIIHPNTHIRGDMTNIRIGRYCSIGANTIIRPPSYQTSLGGSGGSGSKASGYGIGATETQKMLQFLPSLIGNHTRIGQNCVIESASIGSSVYIADNVVISKRVIIKDCCYIEEGTVVAPDTVIPPFSRVGGSPGKIMTDDPFLLPESVAVTFVDDCVNGFSQFVERLEGEQN